MVRQTFGSCGASDLHVDENTEHVAHADAPREMSADQHTIARRAVLDRGGACACAS
ncbi:hypothetical protein PAN31117_03719 [Pandoraea anapnoica]|uniref:Uncharacterized protein n=1 Tax=Pandoraea anapnoica TaxID=2508301 RepID=A0A5E5ABI5_9BURK|nr:hypothetical protein PAN31117_03719 [Pandoraea anapnoica]